jgi:two-component system, chemotaxis family, sensor kinase Cph1
VSAEDLRIYSTKRHGTTLETCDSEPVSTPGCVQSHGVLFALRPENLETLQVSDNCASVLGFDASTALGRPLGEVVGAECAHVIAQAIAGAVVERNPVFVGSHRVAGRPYDVLVHTVDGVALVEFESTRRPVVPGGGDELLRRVTARLQNAASLRELFEIVTSEVRRVTGLSRAMVYRFHADDTGEVVSEDRREDLPSWLGFRYPPHDIPKPAREIFNKIWIRPLADASAELSEMVPLANPATGRPLDMTWCALRGASVMYTEYLQNMGVAASLTLSLRHQGKLWGLIACHHDVPIAIPYPTRVACELLAQFTSLQMAQAEWREQLEYRLRIESVHTALVARAKGATDLSGFTSGSPAMHEGIRATGAAVLSQGRLHTVGVTPGIPEVHALARWVCDRATNAEGGLQRTVFETDRLALHYAPAAAFADVAAGLLAVPLSRGGDALLWFRPPVEKTLRWGGNPHELPTREGPHGARLTPRKSFEAWLEVVLDRSDPWESVEVDAANRLRHMVVDLVLDRATALAEANEQLTRSNDELDAFAYLASHDLKEPLRAINKHAQILHDDVRAGRTPDADAAPRLEAMLRLTERMDGLLDSLLHFSRLGRLQLDLAPHDLSALLVEAIEMLGATAKSAIDVRVPRPLPTVVCEWVRVREVFSNLIGNAVKYRDRNDAWVEVGYIAPGEAPPTWHNPALAPPEALGQLIFYVRDNGIGIDPRHHDKLFRMFKRLHPREAFGGGVGVGLAIVKKLVAQHRGTVWLDSAVGRGSTFYFTLSAAEVRR